MKSDEKRKKIIQAAGDCFARFGYDKTTMDDIGKRVGLNKASLYYYYKDKESIYTEVVYAETEQFMEALQKKVNEALGSRDRIITYLTERLHYLQEMINLHNLSFETLNTVQPIFEKLYQALLNKEVLFLSRQLEQGIADKELEDCDTARIAEGILVVADAIKHRAAPGVDFGSFAEIDYSGVREEMVFVVSLILKGLERDN
ncbi:MAG: TetR/AcrR family transcriptional regulator [Thermodesulfobacteriota bacterium]|nr:TetR/AcrR family transcriptional regulator [Thermodesulfobacteriota bacterium]